MENAPRSIEDLRDGLQIDKSDLDTALIEQPQLYSDVADLYAMAVSQRDEVKLELEYLEAELSKGYRERLNKTEDKVTEKMVTTEIMLDKKYREAQEKLLRAKRNADRVAAVEEAFRQRNTALKSLTALYTAGYFAEATGSRERREASDRNYNSNRETLARHRRGEKAE